MCFCVKIIPQIEYIVGLKMILDLLKLLYYFVEYISFINELHQFTYQMVIVDNELSFKLLLHFFGFFNNIFFVITSSLG